MTFDGTACTELLLSFGGLVRSSRAARSVHRLWLSIHYDKGRSGQMLKEWSGVGEVAVFVNCFFRATASIRNLAWSYELAYIIKVLLPVSTTEAQSNVDSAMPPHVLFLENRCAKHSSCLAGET